MVSATEPRIICETERLVLRELSAGDPADVTFIRALVNDPGWLRFIGDRNVHDDESGRAYVHKVTASYVDNGFGFWAVCTRAAPAAPPLGICGITKRATLPAPDLGFAFLPAARGQGIAREAARACVDHAREKLGMTELLAITDPENVRSIRLLEAVGFTLRRREQLDPADIELCVLGLEL
jgi:ribosomal-protein-alanine N-acetyltransferase